MDRLFVVAGALFFVQVPLFMQQYRMQLRGHVAELQMQVSVMQHRAQETGRTLDQYINKFVTSIDSDFSFQGQLMKGMVARLENLSGGLFEMEHATILTRPYKFVTNFHTDIVQSTFKNFDWGLAFTIEGLVYALFGMLVGYILFSGIFGFFKMCRRLRVFGKAQKI